MGDPGSIPGSGRSPGEGDDNPLQCSCLEKRMGGGAGQVTICGVAESHKIERLHFHFLFFSLTIWDLPGGTIGKEPTFQFRRHKRGNFDPWIERIPGGGNDNPLQYSCLENQWIEEPCRLWTTESQRVKNTWSNLAQHALTVYYMLHCEIVIVIQC